MNENYSTAKQSGFGREVLTAIKSGIHRNEQFENVSSTLLDQISNQILMIDDFGDRKLAIGLYKAEIEKAWTIKRYHFAYESPMINRQLQAALHHLTHQFRVRFSRYI